MALCLLSFHIPVLWLKPEIELVSRDRGGDYAAGARQGAPQAIQVADRFHLYKNLVEAVELILARCRAEIRKNAREARQEELKVVQRLDMVDKSTSPFPIDFGPVFGDEAVQAGLLFPA